MSIGCICCTLKGLLIEVAKLADNKFDYLLIESTGISEPLPVAETFTFEDENGISLSTYQIRYNSNCCRCSKFFEGL